jgi:hypothetical protein
VLNFGTDDHFLRKHTAVPEPNPLRPLLVFFRKRGDLLASFLEPPRPGWRAAAIALARTAPRVSYPLIMSVYHLRQLIEATFEAEKLVLEDLI